MNYLDVGDGSGGLLATKHLNCSLAAIHSWICFLLAQAQKKKQADV
jgi:hypothetical protein